MSPPEKIINHHFRDSENPIIVESLGDCILHLPPRRTSQFSFYTQMMDELELFADPPRTFDVESWSYTLESSQESQSETTSPRRNTTRPRTWYDNRGNVRW